MALENTAILRTDAPVALENGGISRLALEAAKGQHTINELKLAGQHGVHPNQISQWKRQLLERGPDVFNGQMVAR